MPAVWAFHEMSGYDAYLVQRLLNRDKEAKPSFTEATHQRLLVSKNIERHEHAPIRLDMRSEYNKPGYGWTSLLCILTVGIFPWVDAIERKTDFILTDRGPDTEIRRYSYTYRDTTYYSWLTLPFNLFVTPFSAELNQQAINNAQDVPAETIADVFEEDLKRDMNEKKIAENLLNPAVSKPRMAVLRPINRSPEAQTATALKIAETTLEDELVAYQLNLQSTDSPAPSDRDSRDDFARFSKRCREISARTGAPVVVRLELLSGIFNPEKNVYIVTFQGQIADVKKDKYYNFGPIQFTEAQHSEIGRKAGKFFAHRFIRHYQGFKGARLTELK